MLNIQSISPAKIKTTQTMAVTDPIQIEEGLLLPPPGSVSEVGEGIEVPDEPLEEVMMVLKVVTELDTMF